MKKRYYKLNKIHVILLMIFLFLDTGHLKSQDQDNIKELNTANSTSAYFDYFTYKGEDQFYVENPLPDEEYFYNPVLPGWYSDPSICSNGKDYFLVTSTFVYYPGVPIFHSLDLVNWKQIGHVLDRPSQLINFEGQHTSGGIFAPAISYNPHNKTYYMITTNVGAGSFFVKTKDPFGSWSDPVWLRDLRGIDPSFFFDDDGKAYILNNDEPEGPVLYDGHRAIKIREFDVETEKIVGPEKEIVNGGVRPEEKPIWIEGPHIYKINGQYYLMAAEGGTGPWHSEVIFKGDSPMGDFKPWGKNPILTQRHLDPNRKNPITCAGHADLIQTKEGNWWSVFLACRPIENKFENLGRETFLMPVRWSEDGFPYMTQGEETVPMILKRKGVKKKGEVTFGNFEKNESFDSYTLPDYWITLRSPAKDLYSLTEKPGYLTLKCIDINASEKKTPAFVCRRMQHHNFECTTKVIFNPNNDKEAAGLILYKDETHQYFLSIKKSDNNRKVSVEKLSEDGIEILGEQVIMFDDPVKLKVVSRGMYYDFYFAKGDDNQWKAVCQDVSAHFLSTANSFGFTGTTIGMYATSKQM
jgi:xylan 1,4-beta-xylosidase